MASKDVETSTESIRLHCICGEKSKKKEFMINCAGCDDWFHGRCININEKVSNEIKDYHCSTCSPTLGPSILKKPSQAFNPNPLTKPISENKLRTGSKKFMEKLMHLQDNNEKFLSCDEIPINKLKGHELKKSYFETNGFTKPILVEEKDGLDLVTPQKSITLDEIERLVGPMKEISIIDSENQLDHKAYFTEWLSYLRHSSSKQTLNLLSLEFSNTDLAPYVKPPKVVTEVSWVSTMWPNNEYHYLKPEVQKYCLMSTKDCFTDFHIDFGGTSVWYHVLKGSKVFYLIEPTEGNLQAYVNWMNSPDQHQTFLLEHVDHCYKVKIVEGNTVFIPSGWIHAVWTPEESLVFGGNFLNSFNAQLQLKVYDIEKKVNAPASYIFPNFEPLHWHVANTFINRTRNLLRNGKLIPRRYVDNLKTFYRHLNAWATNVEKYKPPPTEAKVGDSSTSVVTTVPKINTLPPQPIPASVDYHRLLEDIKILKSAKMTLITDSVTSQQYYRLDQRTQLSPAVRKRKKPAKRSTLNPFIKY